MAQLKKKQPLTIPIAVESVEQLELPFVAHGIAKWNSHFGIQFGRLIKAKHSLTI